MASFGNRSSSELITCCQEIQEVANIVILTFNHSVIQGARGKEEQNSLFSKGYSKLQWPDSKHNITADQPKSDAIDVWPFTKRWGALSGDPGRTLEIAKEIKRDDETLAEAEVRAWNFVYKSFSLQAGFYIGIASVLGYKFKWLGDIDGDGDMLDQSWFDLPHIQIER